MKRQQKRQNDAVSEPTPSFCEWAPLGRNIYRLVGLVNSQQLTRKATGKKRLSTWFDLDLVASRGNAMETQAAPSARRNLN